MSYELPNDKIARFWSWFAMHEHEIAEVSTEIDPILEVLLRRLQSIHPKLYFEVCTNAMPRELVLTVEGHSKLFPLVDSIVAAAPEIPDWRVIPLKPPIGFEFQTDYEGTRLNPQELWFLPLHHECEVHALGIRVGIPRFNPAEEESTLNALLVILDSALGERSAAFDIDHVELTLLPSSPEREGYLKLTSLPEYIQWMKGKV